MNTWLLAVSAVVLFVIAPCVYFWYCYQTRQLASSFLIRADQLLKENKLHDAAEYLQRYLRINPKDSAIRVRLAETYDKSATTPANKKRAIELYYQAFGYGNSEENDKQLAAFKENEPTLRQRLGELLLETKQYAAAEKEASQLLQQVQVKRKTDPQNKQASELQVQGARLLALAIYEQCILGSWKNRDAEKRSASEFLAQALEANQALVPDPDNPERSQLLVARDRELSLLLSRIYRDEPQWLPKETPETPSLTIQERNERADGFMDALVKAHPQNVQCLLDLYDYRTKYQLPNASEALEAAVALKTDSPNPTILAARARAEQEMAQNKYAKGGRIEDAKPHLESAIKYYLRVLQVKPEDEVALVNLAEIQQQLGETTKALDACKAGLEKCPQSIGLNLLFSQILLDQGRPEVAAQLDRTQKKEGPLDQAERLVAQLALAASQQNSPEMRQSLAGLQQKVKFLRGCWHFQQGDLQKALPIFQEVIQGQKTASAQQASLLLGEVYNRLGQPDQAAQCFEDAAALNPRIATHQAAANAWEALGRLDLVEKHLRQALQANPNNPGMYYQLLAYSVRNGKTDLANEFLDKLAKSTEIPEADRTRFLAQCYELIQDEARAKEAWKTLAAQAKDTPAEQTTLAKQIAAHDPQAAEQALRRALQLDPEYSPARILLAGIIADKGSEENWKLALSYLSENFSNPQEERLRKRLQAMLYASRGGQENLRQAREIMEKLTADPKQAQPEEIVLLARICNAEGKKNDACTWLKTLVEGSTNPTASSVAAYVDLLLCQELPQDEEMRQKLLAGRELWVKKLQTLAPNNPQTLILSARWLKQSDPQAKVEPSIEVWAEKRRALIPKNPQEEARFFETVGDVYFALEEYSAAERWYRQAWEKAADRYPLLARVLARQGKYGEALQICQTAAEKNLSPLPILTAAGVLLEGQPTEADFTRAETLLTEAAERYNDQPNVLNSLAALRVRQERMEEAAVLFRRVLELRPQDAMAMNNLATVLAEFPDKLAEGKALTEKAIAQIGPQASLLDVKGVLLISENKSDQAIPLLEEATLSSQSDPRYFFHLAVAYLRTKKPEKAQEAFHRAQAIKLDQQILTPGDKKFLTELEQALNKSSVPK